MCKTLTHLKKYSLKISVFYQTISVLPILMVMALHYTMSHRKLIIVHFSHTNVQLRATNKVLNKPLGNDKNMLLNL